LSKTPLEELLTTALGINGVDGIFHDASASLVKDGEIIASVEEERFNRKKHSNGIPFNAISYCLKRANIAFDQVDHIGYYLDPLTLKRTMFDDVVAKFECPPEKIRYLADAAARISVVKPTLIDAYDASHDVDFHYINHHLAHAASAYFVSGFERSAILTLDGSGDRETCVLFKAEGAGISKVQDILVYPESLGYIYTIVASHIGLGWIEGPGKLMGLAGYGRPDPDLFKDIVMLNDDPRRPIEIDLSYFGYHLGESGLPAKTTERFGPPRQPADPLSKQHCNLAASTQYMLENAVLHVVRQIPELLPGSSNLCFAGGVALNVRVNRLIIDSRLFRRLFVPPPAHDGGTSLGCALYLAAMNSKEHKFSFDVYCGPDVATEFQVESVLDTYSGKVRWEKLAERELVERAVESLTQNKIIGWAQGRMECGPRALGNRSILANAMNPRTKDELNERVKHREPFRPYSPSVLREKCVEWFDVEESPYMLIEAMVLKEKRRMIPAVTHVDGTSRVQTVTPGGNPRFYNLIKRFYERTGVPVVLNTSFNQHGEPIVNRPEEAVEMLLQTDLDEVFVGDYHVTKSRDYGVTR
jgi:carbamoyltransferase